MSDTDTTPAKGPREVSTIGFPYLGLDEATSVARALLDKGGGIACERDQLAAAMNQMPNSGSFITKIAAAKLFGLIENPTGKFQLTSVGFDILDPSRTAAAKVTAFLSVPLYKRVYEEFKGKQLPSRPAGLENAFVQLGVSSKQKDKARHAFDKSARSAGFFPNTQEDRLVMPMGGGVVPLVNPETDATPRPPYTANVQPTAEPDGSVPMSFTAKLLVDPLIRGMVERMPPVSAGWSLEKRRRWLQTFASNLDLVYGADDDDPDRVIMVEIKSASRDGVG